MSDSSNLQSVVEAAEQAAGAGDFGAAAQHLQRAVQLQEAELGPAHPELANTLNNLGVVCERTGNWATAEESYRRAYAIAAAAFPPEHPFVATSRQNLSDFCAMRGVPLEPSSKATASVTSAAQVPEFTTERKPFAESARAATPAPPAPARPAPKSSARPAPGPSAQRSPAKPAKPAPRTPERPAPVQPVPAPSSAPGTSGVSLGWLAIAALVAVAVIVFAIRPWSQSADQTGGPTASAPQAPPPVAPPSVAPSSSPPAAAMTPAPAPAISPTTAPGPGRSTATAPAPGASKPSSASVTPAIATAQLCRTLGTGGGEWKCTPAGQEVSAGPLYFYTRIKSPSDVVVRYRWYRGDQLRQAGDLQVGANTTAGYRTYSRHTVSGGPANWRVELRTADGRLLHEERFVVR